MNKELLVTRLDKHPVTLDSTYPGIGEVFLMRMPQFKMAQTKFVSKHVFAAGFLEKYEASNCSGLII